MFFCKIFHLHKQTICRHKFLFLNSIEYHETADWDKFLRVYQTWSLKSNQTQEKYFLLATKINAGTKPTDFGST